MGTVAGPFYTFDQLEQLWDAAGGNTSAAPTAAAIALAESSGGQGSTNKNSNGSTDYGAWQINDSNFSGLESSGISPSLIVANPSYNARAAVALFNGAGDTFSDWTTYNSGAYQNFLPSGALDWRTQTTSGGPTQTQATQTGAGTTMPSQSTTQGTGFNYVAQSSGNALTLLQNWITKSGTNSLYLAFAMVFVLVILAALKPTEKFAPWAAGAVLLILMFQQGNGTQTVGIPSTSLGS